MADKSETLPRVSDRALELVMHDVLDGMPGLSLESTLPDGSTCRIVEIPLNEQSPSPNPEITSEPAGNRRQRKVLPFPLPRKPASGST